MIILPETHTFCERKSSQASAHLKITSGACERPQWVQAPATKIEDLSLNLRTQVAKVILWTSTGVPGHVDTPPCNIYNIINKCKKSLYFQLAISWFKHHRKSRKEVRQEARLRGEESRHTRWLQDSVGCGAAQGCPGWPSHPAAAPTRLTSPAGLPHRILHGSPVYLMNSIMFWPHTFVGILV